MSTYYGFRCETCGVDSDQWFNHGQHILLECVRNWDHIAAIRRTNYLCCVLDIYGSAYTQDIFAFLDSHASHDLVFLNEYGYTEKIPVNLSVGVQP